MHKLDNNTVECHCAARRLLYGIWPHTTFRHVRFRYFAQLSRKDRPGTGDAFGRHGPFSFRYRAGQFIRLQRHDGFGAASRVPQVVVDLGSGGTGRLSSTDGGACSGTARRQPANYFTRRSAFTSDVARIRISPIWPLTDKPPLNNPAVRHALALSINNQRLMQSIYYGTAETAAPFYREPHGLTITMPNYGYNPQKSREQLALGIENLTLHLWVPTSSAFRLEPSAPKTAELIQADMAQVGVKVVIVPVEDRFQEARLMWI
ncbi:hypothetical protein KCP78_07375 [Salmonella enterica subsp. enterica]|nr:hypothetical protein KCP78_07375 [Salmonella enterica subsp. enterica]